MVKKLKNSNIDKTQKIKLWQISKTKIVTKLKPQIVTKLKNSNCDKTKKNSNCYKTQNLIFWQNSKTQIVTKLKNSNCNKAQKVVIVTPWQPIRCSWGSFRDSCYVFFFFTKCRVWKKYSTKGLQEVKIFFICIGPQVPWFFYWIFRLFAKCAKKKCMFFNTDIKCNPCV